MKTGIYHIRNLVNRKRYIGSASTDLVNRWQHHRKALRGGYHANIHLQRAWIKYGEDSFVFEVLLYCDPGNCLMYEQIALDHHQPEYNIAKVAGNPRLGVKVSETTKAILSERMSGSNNPMYGRSHSTSSRKKIAAKAKLRTGEKNGNSSLSDLQRIEIRQLRDAGLSLRALARRFGVGHRTIWRTCHGNNTTRD